MKRLILFVAAMLLAANLLYRYRDPGPIQPRDWSGLIPHYQWSCDEWPDQAAICVEGFDHAWILGVKVPQPASIENCYFYQQPDGSWTVSPDSTEARCMLDGQPYKEFLKPYIHAQHVGTRAQGCDDRHDGWHEETCVETLGRAYENYTKAQSP